MKKILFLVFLTLTILFCTGCDNIDLSKVSDEDMARIADKAVVCNDPYILIGEECCLDDNNDDICDINNELSNEHETIVCNKPYIRFQSGCCLDVNDNKICDDDEVKDSEDIIEKNIVVPDITYEMLENNLINIFGKNLTFKQSKFSSDFYLANGNKYVVIEKNNEKIKSVDEFYKKVSAKNWQDFMVFFSNETNFKLLNKPLVESNFDHERKYREYIQKGSFINNTVLEKVFNVENGKVLEYQFNTFITSQTGYFNGVWSDTLVIYKVYCSEDFSVFFRPDSKNLQISLLGSSDSAFLTWQNAINRNREQMLNFSNEILKSCNVEKDFFDNFSANDYWYSEMLAYYYKTYLEFYHNSTSQISVDIQESKDKGKYELNSISLNFTNYDTRIRWIMLLDIEIKEDDGKSIDLLSDRKMGSYFNTGKTLDFTKNVKDDESIYFENNVSIYYKLKTENMNIPIRPKVLVFDINGEIISESKW